MPIIFGQVGIYTADKKTFIQFTDLFKKQSKQQETKKNKFQERFPNDKSLRKDFIKKYNIKYVVQHCLIHTVMM